MSKKMSTEEFKAHKEGKDKVQEVKTSSLSARDFIMNRAKELVQVPIIGPDGTIEIEIRARLTKSEVSEHREFLDIFVNPEEVDDVIAETSTAKFLAAITTDTELNETFWNSDDIDPYIAQELIVAFVTKSAETLENVKSFRSQW